MKEWEFPSSDQVFLQLAHVVGGPAPQVLIWPVQKGVPECLRVDRLERCGGILWSDPIYLILLLAEWHEKMRRFRMDTIMLLQESPIRFVQADSHGLPNRSLRLLQHQEGRSKKDVMRRQLICRFANLGCR